MSIRKEVLLFLIPIIISLILHLNVFKTDLVGIHVWRQTQTQTVIYNFSENPSPIYKPQKFDLRNGSSDLLYEFPIYQWIIAEYNHFFGYSVSHSRIITFIIFCIFLFGFYKLVKLHCNTEIALFTLYCLAFSPLLYYYCVNPMPDIFALTLSTWSIYFFKKYTNNGSIFFLIISSLLLCFATLVKLPYILFGLPIFLSVLTELKNRKFKKVLLILSIIILPILLPLIWYIKAIPTWEGNGITEGLINNKNWGLYFYYLGGNFTSTFPEMLTNYASMPFFITGIFFVFKNFKVIIYKYWQYFATSLAVIVYYLFEANMIEFTHDYYLMPFIPFIFLIVGKGIQILYKSKYKLVVYFLLILLPFTAWIRIGHRWNIDNPGFNTDYLNYSLYFQKIIPKNALCIIDNDESKFISLYYLKRNGFSLYKNELNENLLSEMYMRGGKYLLSDNLELNSKNFPSFDFKLLFKNKLCLYQISKK